MFVFHNLQVFVQLDIWNRAKLCYFSKLKISTFKIQIWKPLLFFGWNVCMTLLHLWGRKTKFTLLFSFIYLFSFSNFQQKMVTFFVTSEQKNTLKFGSCIYSSKLFMFNYITHFTYLSFLMCSYNLLNCLAWNVQKPTSATTPNRNG